MPTPADGYPGDVTPVEAWALLGEGARLVDVRTHAEWNYVGVPDLTSLGRNLVTVEWVGYPSGALNPNFVEQVSEGLGGDTEAPVLFLCRSGVRSVGAAKAAAAAGYSAAYNILEGFEGGHDEHGHRGVGGWRAAGLPWRQG